MIAKLGKQFSEAFGRFLYATGFLLNLIKESALFLRRRQVGFRVLVMQLLFTAVEAMGIVANGNEVFPADAAANDEHVFSHSDIRYANDTVI